MTEMVRVWIKMGMKISNITQFIQYIPGKVLLPFTEKVTAMRCEATYEKDEAKSLTAKLYGNSGELILTYDSYHMIHRLWKMFGRCHSLYKYTSGS